MHRTFSIPCVIQFNSENSRALELANMTGMNEYLKFSKELLLQSKHNVYAFLI